MPEIPSPKFSVGEDVWALTRRTRHAVTVTRRFYRTDVKLLNDQLYTGWIYDVEPVPDHRDLQAPEFVLRKRPQPGQDFDSLMDELNTPTTVKVNY